MRRAPATSRLKISFCTTCMGRLHHIQQTLINNIEANKKPFPYVEFVLLDYNSQDNLEKWVQRNCKQYIDSGILNYFRTTEPQFFKMSHAKNMAALLSTGDVIVNIDADNILPPGFVDHVHAIHAGDRKTICRCGRHACDVGSGGRISILRTDFMTLGGYEESMVGWGIEDGDMRQRARRIGLHYSNFDTSFCRAVYHDDSEREKHHTPPGQKHLSVAQSSSRNREIQRRNTEQSVIEANKGTIWGHGVVTKNFGQKLEVGSGSLKPKELPSELHSKYIPPAPTLKDFVPQLKRVGQFRISKVNAKQLNRPI